MRAFSLNITFPWRTSFVWSYWIIKFLKKNVVVLFKIIGLNFWIIQMKWTSFFLISPYYSVQKMLLLCQFNLNCHFLVSNILKFYLFSFQPRVLRIKLKWLILDQVAKNNLFRTILLRIWFTCEFTYTKS